VHALSIDAEDGAAGVTPGRASAGPPRSAAFLATGLRATLRSGKRLALRAFLSRGSNLSSASCARQRRGNGSGHEPLPIAAWRRALVIDVPHAGTHVPPRSMRASR